MVLRVTVPKPPQDRGDKDSAAGTVRPNLETETAAESQGCLRATEMPRCKEAVRVP